ncbi:MAG: TonB-dependent receptor [Proteobacteria bacterium]|nr:TonB-dependent receptor [Pseudomonadota bacterium]
MNPGSDIASIVANAGPLSGDSGGVEFDQFTLNLDLRRLLDLGGRPLYLAAGLEHRDENYQQNAGDEASWSCGLPHNPAYRAFAVGPDGAPLDGTVASCGFQGYPGYSPTNAALSDDDRDSQAAYLDLEFEPTDRWTLGAALRWEDYSDAGSETTGKLSTRIRLTDQFALRGAFSTGFRAPSLSQRRFNSIVFSASAETGLTTTFFAPEGHEIARFYGVDKLEHETSENWSAGFVWTPSESFRLSVDAFGTEVDDRVVRSLGVGCADIAACMRQNASSAAFFFNGIDTRTRGLDVTAQWETSLAGGDLRVSAGAHFNETEITDEVLPSGAPEGMQFSDYFGGWPADMLERGQPRNQLGLTADWSRESLGATLRLNRYGRTEQNPLAVGPWDVDAAGTVDVEGRYQFDGGLRLTLGVDNVFDELPDELDGHTLDALWGIRYPIDAPPYGLAGRLFYTRLSYRF